MFHYSGYQVDNLGNNPSESQTLLDNEIPFTIFLNLVEAKQYPMAATVWKSNQKLRHYLLSRPIQLSDYSLSTISNENLKKAINLLIDHCMLEIVFYLSESPTVEAFLKDKLLPERSQNLLYQILHTNTSKKTFESYLLRGLHSPKCIRSTLLKAMSQPVIKAKPHLVEALHQYYFKNFPSGYQNSNISGFHNYPNYATNYLATHFSNPIPTAFPPANVNIDLSSDEQSIFATPESVDSSKKRKTPAERVFAPYINLPSTFDGQSVFISNSVNMPKETTTNAQPIFTTSKSADLPKKRKRSAKKISVPHIDLSSELDEQLIPSSNNTVNMPKETKTQANSTTTKILTHLVPETNEQSFTPISTRRKARREKSTATIFSQTEPTAIPSLEKTVLKEFKKYFDVEARGKKADLSKAAKKLWQETPALKKWYRGEAVLISGVETQLPVDKNIYSLFDLFYIDLFEIIAVIIDNNTKLCEALNSSYPNYLLQLLKKSADKDPTLCCQLINIAAETILIKFQPFLPPAINNAELHNAYALRLLKLSVDDVNLCLERISATKELFVLHEFQEFLLESYPDRDLLCTALFNHIAYLTSDSSSNVSDISESSITMGMAQ